MFPNGLCFKIVFTSSVLNGRDVVYMMPSYDIVLSMATGVIMELFNDGVSVGNGDGDNKNKACWRTSLIVFGKF